MYIKHVILEGFKSYGSRTDVGPFDPHFNAITGLNGSGKSNILDGIIFVLGLSSLSNVRADNLVDLIHKGGGCKRGSVSVILDNTDKKGCPIGYERYDEIIVSRTIEETGLCKYYLNSIVSTKKKIVDMFESVQLNISNPNFVIQQGRITKVVNMKAKEILHMIEETVGATFYQTKRDKTEKEVVDKDPYIENVRQTITTIIQPALAKQRKAAQYATEFNSLKQEVHSKSQQYAIAAYGEWSIDLQKNEERLNALKEKETEEKLQIKDIDDDIAAKQKEIDEIKAENNVRIKEKMGAAEKELGKYKRKYDQALAQHESANTNEVEAVGKVKKAESAFKKESKAVEDFHGNRGAIIAENEAIKKEIEAAEQNLQQAKKRESDINAGKALGDDGQVIDLRERVMSLDDEINEIRLKRDHESKILQNDTRNLKQKEAELKNTPSDAEVEKKFTTASNEVRKISDQLQRNNVNPEEYPVLDARVQDLRQTLGGLEGEKRRLMSQYQRFAFSYTDPAPNFNRNSVHGFLFELFMIKEDKFGNLLEIATSNSWTRIIVDAHEVSKALIEKGQLPTRVTFHPISVAAPRRPAIQRDLDKRFGPGKVYAAIDLIQYDKKFENVMNTFFGSVVICEHMEDAKVVAYQLGFKAVTFTGEVLEAGGTMQGGTRSQLGHFLKQCQRFASVTSQIKTVTAELNEATQKFMHYSGFLNQIKAFEVAKKNLASLEALRQCTPFASLTKEVTELKESTSARSGTLKDMDAQLKAKVQETNSCKKKLESEAEYKAKNLKEIKTQIQKCEKELAAAKKKYESKQKTYNDIETEVQAKRQMLAEYEKDIEAAKKELEEAREDIKRKKALLDEEKAAFQEKTALLEAITKENKQCDAEINTRENQIKQSQKMKQKLEVGKIKRDNDLKAFVQRVQARRKDIDDLMEKHNTVKYDDYENLQKPEESAAELKHGLVKAEKRLEEMSTKVDQETADKLDTTLHGAKMAEDKSRLVERNRVHLTKAMEVLDANKRRIVMQAYHQINKEFGSMMTTLLPEAEAKLVPVNSDDLSDGLNIHVCLGGSWKESLLELSGGQRSLVALALVLSLCMFKPAPFYILDEVDAALDLSHTQNMGVIIKQRFRGTQFVCVSLKEGMFTNANTLFSVTFNRGVSTVACSQRKKIAAGGSAAPRTGNQKAAASKSRRAQRDSEEDAEA